MTRPLFTTLLVLAALALAAVVFNFSNKEGQLSPPAAEENPAANPESEHPTAEPDAMPVVEPSVAERQMVAGEADPNADAFSASEATEKQIEVIALSPNAIAPIPV